MKLAILFLLTIFVMGCNNQGKKSDSTLEESMNQPRRSLSDLKSLVLTNGDTEAYYELKIAYLDNEYPEEFLIFAIIMANRFNYPEAYFDVYISLKNVYYSDLTKMDINTANLAIEYLLKADEKQHEQAQEIVKEFSIRDEISDNRALIIKINQ